MIILMFDPKLGDSLRTMSESMPQLFAAFGMADVGTTLIEFVVGYLYGILFIGFPSVFIIILSNRLVARYIDQGSMAYLLATPNKRRKLVTTQAVFFALCLLVLVLYVTALIIITAESTFPGELDLNAFFRINLGLYGLLFFLGGVCFLLSCICNDTKYSNGIGAGFVILSILVQMISQVGDKFSDLKYATPLTLYNTDGLIAAENGAYMTCGVLYLAGILFIIAGILIFERRNLPI